MANSDWYLPSKDELNALYTKKDSIGGFTNTEVLYRNSTEYNYGNAWGQVFTAGKQFANCEKHFNRVRCIRKR